MGDGGKEHERNAILEKALKSANIADARSTWPDIGDETSAQECQKFASKHGQSA